MNGSRDGMPSELWFKLLKRAIIRHTRGDTRSLDYSSSDVRSCQGHIMFINALVIVLAAWGLLCLLQDRLGV